MGPAVWSAVPLPSPAGDLAAGPSVRRPRSTAGAFETWLGRPGNTWEYYRELADRGPTYLPDQDVSSWIRFNLTAYHQQA